MATASRSRSAAVLVGGVVVLVVIAGAGRWLGHTDVHDGTVASASSRATEDAVRFVFVLALIVGLGCWFLVMRSFESSISDAPRPGKRRSFVQAAVRAVISLALLLAVWSLLRGVLPPSSDRGGGGGGAGSAGGQSAGHANTADWPFVVGLVVVVLLVAAGAALLRRSRRAFARSAEDLPRDMGVPDESSPRFDVSADLDPREAVVAAYHWLLAVLRVHGCGRDDWEAPVEHVERVLVSDGDLLRAGRTVADAFELARYSDHEVSDAVRTDAIASARAVVDRVDGQVDRRAGP
ncbi:MAG TPA: DUF4129 domain-containing protein [Acidimicrobiales bacterium]|nr:DUF4129 domain-containing protein [Acidimicrobiales bacterium]